MTTLIGGVVNLIGIHGMGGLGKTTMAIKIRNRVLDENVFQEVAMAVVSQQADMSNIQVEIGGQLGLEYQKKESSQARAQKLHARLSDGTKRSLVILDDVWERLELEDLGIPCDSEWCTILITSRNEKALSEMGCKDENRFGMKILSEEEAWCLFREGAGTCVDDPNLNPIAKQVAQECKGLPIALKTLGLALKDKSSASIWNDALRELKEGAAHISDYIKKVYTPLIMSYNFLYSDMAKSLFLLCCLFPEDSDIPLEELTYFCMGLGIFEGITNVEDARNKMCTLIDTLKRQSLLLDGYDENYVRMHDVIRDVCIYLAKQKGCIGGNDCTWISSSQRFGERTELLTESRFPNLRLLSLRDIEFGSAFLEGIKDLNVACIEISCRLTSVPQTTSSFENLKTLLLYKCWMLKSISFVGKLRNLEILVCRHCEFIEELPLEMKGLNRLKLLDLTGCKKIKSIGRGIISSLVGLEELKMLWSFNGWEAEDREERENAALTELEALTNLRCLEIEIRDRSLLMENMPLLSKKIVKFVIRSGRDDYSLSGFRKAMSLCLKREGRLGDWIEMQLVRDTEFLYLKGKGANNVDLAKSQNIRWLELRNCKSKKNVVRTSGGSDDATVFPSLEHLKLDYLPDLQEICDGPISSTSFQNLNVLKLEDLWELRKFWKSCSVCENNNNVPHFTNLSSIDISNCDRLCNLGQLSMAGKDCLPQLETLEIRNCLMMEQVFLWNDEEESHVIRKVLPKLKKVWLFSLPNLTTFYQGIEGIEFPLLTSMEIRRCPKMKSIIMASNETSNSGEITSSSADDDIDDTWHLFCQSGKISFGSSLEILHINRNPFCGHEIPSWLFNGLEVLTISECVGSMSLFTLSMAANLVSLRELTIRSCHELIKVIEDEQHQESILVFPKLEILLLKHLPKLVSFCDSKCEVELPSLRKVEIFRCPNMKSFSMGLVMVATPNLEGFTTDLSTYVGVGADDVAFDRLKELMIVRYKNPFVDRKISVSLFNRLEKLEFYVFNGSMSLFSSSAFGNLVNLKVLCMGSGNEIVKVIEDEEDDVKVVSGGEIITSVVIFPKLEKLYLHGLPKLVRFCEWKCDVELPSLRKVEIFRCPNMESFSMGFVSAPNLKTVEIDFDKIDATKDLNVALLQHRVARLEKLIIRRRRRRRRSSEEENETEEDNQN